MSFFIRIMIISVHQYHLHHHRHHQWAAFTNNYNTHASSFAQRTYTQPYTYWFINVMALLILKWQVLVDISMFEWVSIIIWNIMHTLNSFMTSMINVFFAFKLGFCHLVCLTQFTWMRVHSIAEFTIRISNQLERPALIINIIGKDKMWIIWKEKIALIENLL